MAKTDVETLVLQMSGDVRGLQKALDKAQREAAAATGKIEDRFDRMNGGINKSFSSLGNGLKAALATVAVGALVKDAQKIADTYTDVRNALKLYVDVLGDTDEAQKRVVATAIDTKQNFEAIGKLVSVTARIAGEIGESSENVFLFTEAVGKGAAIVNTGAAATSAALFQLGQALGSPRVQMGEFNSIIEGTPRLAKAFAEGVIGAGASVSQLKARITDMSGDGVSGAELFRGLLSQLPQLRKQFAAADVTVAAAFTNLQTRITAYVGEANEATGATKAIIPLINFLADSVDDLANVAVVGIVALAGALTGLGAAGVVSAIGATTSAVLGARAAYILAATEIAKMTLASGAASAVQLASAQAALKSATSLNVLGTAAKAGAGAMGLLRNAMAFLSGPGGWAVLGAVAAILALELSKVNTQLQIQERVTREIAPQVKKIEELTRALAKAEGANAVELRKSRAEELKSLTARARLAQANLALAESNLKVRESELLKARSFSELSQLDPEAQAGVIAGLAGDEGRIARQRKEVEELRRQITGLIDTIAEADAAGYRAQGATAKPPTADPTAGAGVTATTDAVADMTARIEANFDRAEQAAADAEQALMDALDAAEAVRAGLRDDAESFLDRLPGSTRAAYAELAKLRALISEGIFTELGAENEAALAQVDLLVEIAARAGTATDALAELAKVNGLTTEQAARGAEQIKRAAREARAVRDEELGRLFREQEIRDDVKSALYEAMQTGQYAEVFRERMADALDRASQRALDKFVDVIFDTIGGIGGGGLGSIFGGKSAKSGAGGIFDSFFSALIGGFFGGGRATGGPINPGKFYVTGEKGPELIVPRSQGHVIPNSILAAMSGAPRNTQLTTRSEVNIAYTIDLAGANGDQAIALIARRESQRGIAEALKVVDRQAPSRQQRFVKLGT